MSKKNTESNNEREREGERKKFSNQPTAYRTLTKFNKYAREFWSIYRVMFVHSCVCVRERLFLISQITTTVTVEKNRPYLRDRFKRSFSIFFSMPSKEYPSIHLVRSYETIVLLSCYLLKYVAGFSIFTAFCLLFLFWAFDHNSAFALCLFSSLSLSCYSSVPLNCLHCLHKSKYKCVRFY